MKQLLVGLVAIFAFGTAFAQSATPVAADAPAAPESQSAEAAAVPAGAEEVFTAPAGAAEVPTVAVPKVAPNISHTMMGVGAAALVAIALTAGGGSDDDRKDDCSKPNDDCPSSP